MIDRFSLRDFGLIAAFAFLVLTPIARASEMDSAAKTLAKLDDEWSNTAATRDAAKIAAFYAENAIAYPPNAPMAVGREAAQKVWASYFEEPSFKISWKTAHAGVAKGGDWGFTSGTYEATWKGPDGKTMTEKGKYLCNWQKQPDGSWKAAHDMWNSDAK